MARHFTPAPPTSRFLTTPPTEGIMSEHIHHVTDDSFEPEVLQAQIPVLVDYWAEWCGPCKMVAPILDELAKDYAGRLKIAKLDIDQNDKVAARYGVRG